MILGLLSSTLQHEIGQWLHTDGKLKSKLREKVELYPLQTIIDFPWSSHH